LKNLVVAGGTHDLGVFGGVGGVVNTLYNPVLIWRRTRWDMLRLSLWKRSNRYIDEAEFGSNLMSISTTGWIGWRKT
jgi:hypothetical protein